MAAFVRFVFTIMIVGMVVNLAIVLLANSQSQRSQDLAYRENAARFAKLVGEIDSRIRRADIVVESQREDAHRHVLESTLLIRQYHAAGAAQSDPLPIIRIVIPGDKLQATGLLLEFVPPRRRQAEAMPAAFDANFIRDYPMLDDVQLPLFGLFCGADEVAPPLGAAHPGDERFTFIPRDRVPELARLDPKAPQASHYEIKLWQNIWNQLPEIPRNTTLPWVSKKSVVKAIWTKPATITVRLGHTCSAYVTTDGITLNEDEPGISDLVDVMLRESKKLILPVDE